MPDTDGIEIRITGWATTCLLCDLLVSTKSYHQTKALLRDGLIHALEPGRWATLCGILNESEEA